MNKPTILDQDTLICDSVFMTKELISEKCDCGKRRTCMLLVDLLKNGQLESAYKVIENNFIYTEEYGDKRKDDYKTKSTEKLS